MPRIDRDPGVLDGRTTKLAVHAGIAASDVICLRRLGYYWQSGNNHEAIDHLRQADAPSAVKQGAGVGGAG